MAEPAQAVKNSTTLKTTDPAEKVDAGGVFGSMALRTNINLASRHWKGAVHKMHLDGNRISRCGSHRSTCTSGVKLLADLIKSLKGKPVDAGLLDEVNRHVNTNIRYTSDRRVFGLSEHWAGPSEVMGGRGDCEDYVIAKYFILTRLGVSDKDLKVVVVRDLASGVGHAVLAVTLGGRTLILDNQMSVVRDHMKISRYQPLYSINRKTAWLNLAVKRAPADAVLVAGRPAPAKLAAPVREASLHATIAVHLARKKPLQLMTTAAAGLMRDVHY